MEEKIEKEVEEYLNKVCVYTPRPSISLERPQPSILSSFFNQGSNTVSKTSDPVSLESWRYSPSMHDYDFYINHPAASTTLKSVCATVNTAEATLDDAMEKLRRFWESTESLREATDCIESKLEDCNWNDFLDDADGYSFCKVIINALQTIVDLGHRSSTLKNIFNDLRQAKAGAFAAIEKFHKCDDEIKFLYDQRVAKCKYFYNKYRKEIENKKFEELREKKGEE